jgi:biotin carboxylase
VNDGFLLVLGGNRMAVPAIEVLEASGYRTLVLDRAPDAPARNASSRFVAVDFSDTAATRAAVAAVELIGAMPLNDFAVRTAAAIAAERGLRGVTAAAAWRLTNKVAMKQAWDEARLPTAAWTWARKADILAGRFPAWTRFPCIVKPAFSGGASRGVGRAQSWAEVRRIVETGAATYIDPELVIEEYIAGTEHTIEMVVAAGEHHLLSISDKQNYPDSYTVVQRLVFPGPIGHAHRPAIERLVVASARALGIDFAATHTEVIIRDREPYLLEVGGRPGGGINFHPICQLSAGYCYPRILAALLTGRAADLARGPQLHLAWEYFDHGPGVVREIRGFDALRREPDVVDLDLYEQPGCPALDKRDDLSRPGFVLVKAPTLDEARARGCQLAARVEFEIVPSDEAESSRDR